jgi:DNA-3-methyladenine glycosylase II
MYMTRTKTTDERRAAALYLGSLEDPLTQWVYATGPVDAYAMHLPVAVRDPLEWLSFWIVSQ